MANPHHRSARRAARAAVAALVLTAAVAGIQPASAQTRIAALVNGTPITSTEVNERRAFIKITQHKDVAARAALDLLIDEELIKQEAKRRSINVSDSDVDQRFTSIAANMKLSTDQLGQALAQSGASSRTFKDNIRSQLVQRKLVTARMRTTGVAEKDIAAQMAERKQRGDDRSFRYVLQQIVFVVPQGSGAPVVAKRHAEAESLRGRVKSCEQAVAGAKQIRDVAAKAPVIRMSGQLPATMRETLGKLPVGGTLPSSQNEQGVEFVVLCEKKDAPDDTALRNEIQTEIASELTKPEADKYTAELRKRALIQYR
jgi:peptidyl-prolyl cis-trans isomerase SurA